VVQNSTASRLIVRLLQRASAEKHRQEKQSSDLQVQAACVGTRQNCKPHKHDVTLSAQQHVICMKKPSERKLQNNRELHENSDFTELDILMTTKLNKAQPITSLRTT